MAALAGCRWKFAVLAALVLLVPIGAWGFTLPPGFGFIGYSANESGATPNGVSPNSGPTGTTFTFRVLYYDVLTASPGTAPNRAELHIDADGDGVVGGTLTAFAPGPWIPRVLAGVAGIWAALLLISSTLPRLRTPVAHAAAASALLLVVVACGGSDSNASHGGLALANCSSISSEVIPLDDAGDDYTVGAEFTKTLELTCSPGVVLFKFHFVNHTDTEIALGSANNLNKLEITP